MYNEQKQMINVGVSLVFFFLFLSHSSCINDAQRVKSNGVEDTLLKSAPKQDLIQKSSRYDTMYATYSCDEEYLFIYEIKSKDGKMRKLSKISGADSSDGYYSEIVSDTLSNINQFELYRRGKRCNTIQFRNDSTKWVRLVLSNKGKEIEVHYSDRPGMYY